MPKQIDHDRRRAEIAEATWRLIAKRGIEAATMREITAALGMAHGALKHYFPDKNAIIKAAFTHVFEATNARIGDRLGDATGLAGLRVFCREVLPADEVTELEARVVLPFWQRALADAELESVFAAAMTAWRERMAGFLRAGRAEGSVGSPVADEVLVEQLLAMLNGLQVQALLTPGVTTPGLQRQVVEAFVDGLGPGAVAADTADGASASIAGREAADFLSFAQTAVGTTAGRLPETDRQAMTMVLLLHRVANTVVYDLESTVHRPAGWSWSAFRLLFTVWVAGPQEAGRAAELAGMSRAAVSSLAKTLAAAGLVDRTPDERDRRGVVLSLTKAGKKRLEGTFREHNRREARWAGLLTAEELTAMNNLLARLARTAQAQDWVSHRV